uniref:Uncharacterized protein n=1 Tax=Arundo donax TaxID=35708 RepID=A0A0A8YF27_ARUDO
MRQRRSGGRSAQRRNGAMARGGFGEALPLGFGEEGRFPGWGIL